MSIVKPYTFVAGTKARANEVNEDFDRLYQQVNENITNIATNSTDITNLGIDKANVAGDATQRFAVADATGDYDAINKQTLQARIANSVDIISGLQITKDSNSPNDTIIVSTGAAYDNERVVILKLANPLSKKNDNQLANATYYVYIIGDNYGTTTDILISTSQIVPALPSGYERYRKIGYFTTDSSGNISKIYSFGINPDGPLGIQAEDVMPDMGRIISGISSGFVANASGYINIIIKINSNDPQCMIMYNGIRVARYSRGGDYGDRFRYTFFAPIAQGDTMTWSLSGGSAETAQFIYCKGA